MLTRRLPMVFSIVILGSLAFAAGAVAAGGGGLGPGNYSFSNKSADASFGMGGKGGPAGPSWSVFVNEGLNSFKPRSGGSRLVDNSTVVFVTEFDALGNGGYGCFVVPNSDFTVSRDLSTAALHTTLTLDEVCPGYASPVDGGNSVAYAGGGEGGLELPIRVDVTWTGRGAAGTSKSTFTFRCLTYGENGSGTYSFIGASASGTISDLDGSFAAEYADVNTSSGLLNIHNVPPDACLA